MRILALKQYIVIVLALMTFILGVWSIYWGSMFDRSSRYVNLRLLIAVETNQTAPISQAMIDTTLDPRVSTLAGWDVQTNMNASEIPTLVHEQKYWAAIYVSQNNVSQIINQGFQQGKDVNTTGMIQAFLKPVEI